MESRQAGRGRVRNAGGTSVAPWPDPWAWLPAPLRRVLPFIPAPASRAPTTTGSASLFDAR